MHQTVDQMILELTAADRIAGPSQPLSELGIDSLRLIELILLLEQRMAVTFRESDLDPERFQTVGDLYALSEQYAAART